MKKEDILEEIRRLAELNGGVPLGRDRFHQRTGLKSSIWYGKFWTKWNDAVIEAGYTPNKMNKPFKDEYLLEKYAKFISEIRQVPTAPELRMRAKKDSNFPSHNTFNRFGSKKKLIGRLIEFCKANEHFSNLVHLLEKTPHIKPSEEAPSLEGGKTGENGFVYLIQFGNEYKIGTSNNVERRFRELKTQMPYEGKIIHTIQTGDPKGIEAYWHNFFAEKRLKGEWFLLSEADTKYFKKRKLM